MFVVRVFYVHFVRKLVYNYPFVNINLIYLVNRIVQIMNALLKMILLISIQLSNKFLRKYDRAFFQDESFDLRILLFLKPSDAYQFFTTGQQKIQQGLLREGFELISEAHNLLNNVYGPMHPEISMCLRLLARLNYIMGDYQEALYTQHKAVMMSERVLGIDHPQTATEYVREKKNQQQEIRHDFL